MSNGNDTRVILYEFPINNRTRSFLRYEYLIKKIDRLIAAGCPLEAIGALSHLVEILRHADLKSELLRHLRWQEQQLQLFSERLEVDHEQVTRLIQAKRAMLEKLDHLSTPSAQLAQHDFLAATWRRLSIPGGTCNFDLPLLHAWLALPDEDKRAKLEQWLAPFRAFNEGVADSLTLTRHSGKFEKKQARDGYFSINLRELQAPPHLFRIRIPGDEIRFPEFSANKNVMSAHFFKLGNLRRPPEKTSDSFDFELACCTL